jgi:hypothetical protein
VAYPDEIAPLNAFLSTMPQTLCVGSGVGGGDGSVEGRNVGKDVGKEEGI